MEMVAPSLIPDLRESALLLDVDGTLLDLAPTPPEVWVPPSLRNAMGQLAERSGGAVAFVSGRSLSELDRLFSPLTLPAIGGHGAELRPTAGIELPGHRPILLDAAIKRRFALVAEIGPGILIEDKGYAIALHYRLAPQLEGAVRKAVDAIYAENPSTPIEILPGKFVLEVKQKGFSKATGVRELMRHPPFLGRHPIFIGDDVTDEPVFEMIGEFSGLGFSVGRKMAGVDGHFEKPEAVRRWLSRIAGEHESAAQ
jgi:trehalose 6-phosphate phosphatase